LISKTKKIKIKIIIIIMQIKKGRKKDTGGSFFSHKKEYTWGGTKKKTERESREEEKIDSPVCLTIHKLRSKKRLKRRQSFLKNAHRYDL